MTTAPTKDIHPSNTYLVRQQIRQYDAATNSYIPWVNAAGIVVGFYEDASGATAIAGLTNLPMTESSTPGTYYCLVDGTLTATLSSQYVGETIYQIVTAGVYSDLRVVLPLRVSQPRYVQVGA